MWPPGKNLCAAQERMISEDENQVLFPCAWADRVNSRIAFLSPTTMVDRVVMHASVAFGSK